MWFLRFIKACRKYYFTFTLSTYCGLELLVRHSSELHNIKINVDCNNYNKLFREAIKVMKEYSNARNKRNFL